MKPLVTIVCIGHNHERYLKEALESVFSQSYPELQIIIVDDASSDASVSDIKEIVGDRTEIELIFHPENQGYTSAFNQAFRRAKGEYIVDFALDDVMLPSFIEKSVSLLEAKGAEYGVSFCNADYLNAESVVVGNHNTILREKGLMKEVPQGAIFADLLARYFICTPTMLIRKSVLDRLGGYDDDLAYEDFDFWVRSSRFAKYTYLDEVLIQKRKLPNSMSAQQYHSRQNDQLRSTLAVCRKAFHLVQTKEERRALRSRCRYELGHCITKNAPEIGQGFIQILEDLGYPFLQLKLFAWMLKSRIDFNFLNSFRR